MADTDPAPAQARALVSAPALLRREPATGGVIQPDSIPAPDWPLRCRAMTVNPLLFWAICAMAAIGFVQAVLTVLKREPPSNSLFDKPEAPEGFEWVLMRTDEATTFRESVRR